MKRVKREAVRALILTPEGEILLMRAEEPDSGRQVWFTPGGGVESGENPKTCLRRELDEETAVHNLQIGPPVWTRRATFDWAGQRITQDETFYLIRSNRFTPTNENNPDPVEGSAFREFRWWSVEQISASEEIFAPRHLADYLKELIDYGPPHEPFDTGI
jgi:ADP-ribose pyrophosphatase YjhB (NUDIX family)